MNEDNPNRVEALSDRLYSRTRYKDPLVERHAVRPKETPEVNQKWQSPELNDLLTREREVSEPTPFMKKFFAFALLFFTATIVVAGVIFLGGANFVSSKNVDISVVGPTNISAGEMLELGVTIENSNNTALIPASFSVQYPQGARDPEDTARALTYTKKDLGEIGAGDEALENVRMVLIGTTGETKQIKFSVEYKIKGSNATFYKDKIYDITIGETPMTMTIESPESVSSGDSFTTKVKLKLHSTEILRNVMLRAEYPYGFSVLGATPEAIADNNVWALGDFAPGGEKTIEIRGRLVGENQDERTFRFYAGVSDDGGLSPDFKSVIVSTQETVAIERPSIGLATTFNGDPSAVYVAPAGRNISSAVRFQNNLPDKIVNPRLAVKLTGASLDEASVQVQGGGFFDSGSNTITWNFLEGDGAAELLPGDSGSVNFSFSSLPLASLPLGNKDMTILITLSGTPVGGKTISINESRTIKIASQVTFSSKAYYSIGPFKNTGPLPPKVEATTTYSVVWSVGNTQDDIKSAVVTARLGQGVKWVKNSGSEEDISYDDKTNTVTWKIGSLSSGSGFSSQGREGAFQVALTPSLSQVGTVPILVLGTTLKGLNATTEQEVSVTGQAITTRISSDPAFIQGDDIVQKK